MIARAGLIVYGAPGALGAGAGGLRALLLPGSLPSMPLGSDPSFPVKNIITFPAFYGLELEAGTRFSAGSA